MQFFLVVFWIYYWTEIKRYFIALLFTEKTHFEWIYFLFFFFVLIERLAEGEFIKGVIENETAMRLIHYEPLKH